jgi:hypothetical protein
VEALVSIDEAHLADAWFDWDSNLSTVESIYVAGLTQ